MEKRALGGGLLVFAGYYLGAQLGLALTFQPHPVSVMWPPNSILLSALLLSPRRMWWFVLLCAFPAHVFTELNGGVPLRMSLCWFVSNSVEALIGAAATRFLTGPSDRFDRLRGLAILFACGGLLGPFLSSFLDSAFVSLNRWGQQSYWQVWQMRFSSNVFTAVALTPVIVGWGFKLLHPIRWARPRRYVEAAFVAIALLAASLSVFGLQQAGAVAMPILLYAPLPFLLWTAVRFGPVATSTAILSVALLAIWGAVHGHGPFVTHSAEQNALSIQVFFIVVSATMMALSVTTRERRLAEETFATAFRSNPDAIIMTRLSDAQIIDVNERWENMFGYARQETLGKTVQDLRIFASRSERDKLAAGMKAGTLLHDLELCLRLRSGELRNTLISASTHDIAGVPCLLVTLRDITDRKRAEEAQRDLAHASRLGLAGELTAMVAHEINQPLSAILSNTEAAEMLLESEKPPLDEVRQILKDIRENDLRADEAIRRIRALLRRRDLQLEPLNFNHTISGAVRLAMADAQRRRVMIIARTCELPAVLGDNIHLQQVLLNLILNAMDAMDECAEPDRQISISAQQGSAGEIQVTISDRGHGIDPEKLPRVFDSFFSTRKEGMGLGLSISRSIIERHGGRIWAENNRGAGASFHFTVRTAENETEAGRRCHATLTRSDL